MSNKKPASITVTLPETIEEPVVNYEYMRTLREKKVVSVIEVAYTIDHDRSQLDKLFKGEILNPSFITMAKLADYFDCDLSDLYTVKKEHRKISGEVKTREDLAALAKDLFMRLFKEKVEIRFVK